MWQQIFLRLVSQLVYNLFLHPLRKVPGPLTHRATRLTYIYYARSGMLHHRLRDLQERYGPVVRIAPQRARLQ